MKSIMRNKKRVGEEEGGVQSKFMFVAKSNTRGGGGGGGAIARALSDVA